MASSTSNSPEIPQRNSCWPEILKRLPAKHLGKCLCVSKKWHKLITSPSFIKSHTIFLSQKPKSSNLFLIRHFSREDLKKPGKEFYHICSETPKSNQPKQTLLKTLSKSTHLCPFPTRNGMEFRVVGTANGVICLSDDMHGNTYNFILWNPLVNCFIQLPKPRITFDLVGCYMHVEGFGFSSIDGDYKMVRVVYVQRRDGLNETPPRVEVYSVKKGKWSWVNAEEMKYCVVDKMWTQCFMRGSVHWVAYERYGEENECRYKRTLVLLFDVETEKFKMMKLPKELRGVCPINLEICEFQGLLCVKHNVRSDVVFGDVERFDVWVKKEYTNGGSWCKVVSVDNFDGRLKVVFRLRENGDLLAINKNVELVSYNPKTENSVVLSPKARYNMFDAHSFVESLAFLEEGCKNRRSFVPVEDETSCSDEEDQEFTLFDLSRMFFGMTAVRFLTMENFRHQF